MSTKPHRELTYILPCRSINASVNGGSSEDREKTISRYGIVIINDLINLTSFSPNLGKLLM